MSLNPRQLNVTRLHAVYIGGSTEHGFTLVELIMIMVIIGVLAVVAAPRFFDADIFRSRGFADQVQASLRYAQKMAIAKRRFVCVAFGANSVTLTYDPVAPSATHPAMTACPGGSPLAGLGGEASYSISSSNASFSAIPAAFYFDALGRPSIAANQTITVSNAPGSIVIEAETGYVHQ